MRAKAFFFLLEIARNHSDNGVVLVVSLLGYRWTNLCKVWANFHMCSSNVLVILGKFIEDIWANYLQFWASLAIIYRKFTLVQIDLGNFALTQILKKTLLPDNSSLHTNIAYCQKSFSSFYGLIIPLSLSLLPSFSSYKINTCKNKLFLIIITQIRKQATDYFAKWTG